MILGEDMPVAGPRCDAWRLVTAVVCLLLAGLAVNAGEAVPAALAARAARPADTTGGAPTGRPNILFILTDDQRWDSLGAYGNTSIHTPALDRLASGGVRLDRYYVSSPHCSPSRASFLTGLWPHQTGVLNNAGRPDLPAGMKTVADYLDGAGYVTGFVGKAHMGGDPLKWGFKETPLIFPYAASVHENPSLMIDGEMKQLQGTVTELLADAAIGFIEEHRTEPWFLWFATTAPHTPYIDDPKHPYDRSAITSPPGWPPGQKLSDEDWTGYYSTISMMDEQIGRVLETLDRLGLSKNTLVIFTSDNGYMLGSHSFEAKIMWFEESARVPAIVSWPGVISPGTSSDALFSAVDLLPTVLEAAGAATPGGVAGSSMIPTLKRGWPRRRAIYSEAKLGAGLRGNFWQMVRTDRWKYVRFDSGVERLYDLKNDPNEQDDLSESPAWIGRLAEMRREMRLWTGDPAGKPAAASGL